MGYDVHITRAADWTESESLPIRLDEWKSYVALDSEFALEIAAVAELQGGGVLAYDNDGLAVWTAFTGHAIDGNKAWFDYRDGRIVVKNPNDEMIRKMKTVAAHLNARVIGDEGELY